MTSQTGVANPYRTRVALLTGATSWTLHALPDHGLRPLVLSDGPIGVRGLEEDTRPSAQLPNPSALAATWDLALISRLGGLVAGEARRKGVDVVLAPVVNLQRTPYGGRHFETFSEDPLLTGAMAAELIRSTQSLGIALCVKHFVGNESETDRTTYLARIPEQALREVYLAPFERAVEAGVWSVMAAYNAVDDGREALPATEHSHLINSILKGEWGFDGVVVSDWLAANSTVESALGGLDLVMPGPNGPWGSALEDAIADGDVPEAVIDDKVERIVRLGTRVGAVGDAPALPVDEDLPTRDTTRDLLRETVARSIVVLGNDGLLPLAAGELDSVALIGPNALEPFVQGGGSASVRAPYLAGPESALRDALPNSTVTVFRGASSYVHPRAIDPRLVTTPDGRPGYWITFLSATGDVVGGAQRAVPAGEEWNRDAPPKATRALIRAIITLDRPGTHRIGVGVSGAHLISFDGEIVSESRRWADHDVILDSSANNPAGPSALFEAGDTKRAVIVESDQQVVDAGAYGRFVRFALRYDVLEHTADEEIEQAVAAATAAGTAIVVVGSNSETESEGWDRQTLELPGRQNELVERVIAANPRTVVVVNAGAPVILPWLDRAAAVLWWWLPGQEAGTGLADALLGVTEPSGRLPWTLPADEHDVPVSSTTPISGVIDYAEGVHTGYRGWELLRRRPAREFGYGLGYGTWSYEQLELFGQPDELVAYVDLTNTGTRDAREIVQVYLEAPGSLDPGSTVERPVRWLAGFAVADLAAGESRVVHVPVQRRALEIWNVDEHRWEIPDGRYVFRAGRSSRDLRLSAISAVQDQRLAHA